MDGLERKRNIRKHIVEEYYCYGLPLVYLDNIKVDKTFEEICVMLGSPD